MQNKNELLKYFRKTFAIKFNCKYHLHTVPLNSGEPFDADHMQNLLCCSSWSKEVGKTLSQLNFIFYVVMMMWLVCWS